MLNKNEINSNELIELVEKRKNKEIDFLLIDVREDMEYNMGYIDGVDMLKPTSAFNEWAKDLLENSKDKKVIFTCRTGNRSGQVTQIFKANGHNGAINHNGGIMSYNGKTLRP
ncbi:MAG: rhodanese-like domain-containing protein [Sulfurovaceae bacterium]|nr:rhodanese-like domain-containing protein [Sulfurovaceae bacterium]MDD5548159.1 rhodanese-like domain-containing protein [Sulfurovaceae bacterium]